MFWVTGSSYLTVNSSLALDVFQIEMRGGGCPREASFKEKGRRCRTKEQGIWVKHVKEGKDEMSVWENLSMFTREWMY